MSLSDGFVYYSLGIGQGGVIHDSSVYELWCGKTDGTRLCALSRHPNYMRLRTCVSVELISHSETHTPYAGHPRWVRLFWVFHTWSTRGFCTRIFIIFWTSQDTQHLNVRMYVISCNRVVNIFPFQFIPTLIRATVSAFLPERANALIMRLECKIVFLWGNTINAPLKRILNQDVCTKSIYTLHARDLFVWRHISFIFNYKQKSQASLAVLIQWEQIAPC